MKTPRELLLKRHRQAQSKLDVIRREALATPAETKPKPAAISFRQLWHSLRWHVVGLSAIWVFILLLHFGANQSTQMMAAIPSTKAPSRQFIMTSVRENRRQLAEMIGPLAVENQRRDLSLPKPRSERRSEMLMA